MEHGRVKIKLKDGRIRTLLGVLHIPNLVRNLISVKKMDVLGVKAVCGDGGCKMVRGSMVLMRRFRYGTLYKLLGGTIIDECNSSFVPKGGDKVDRTLMASRGETMLWHQRKMVKVPIPIGVNLYVEKCPKTHEEQEDMS